MTSYIGVDWAGSCWLVVKTGDETYVTTEPSVFNVWYEHGKNEDVQSILVDIPIGLPETETRVCDQEASEMLSSRSSTVFSIPSRDVVETDDYNDARSKNGDSLGSQSWWLFPRIREVDVFLQDHEEARDKIFESHPEVCYAALDGKELSSKGGDGGIDERLDVLDNGSDLFETVKSVVNERRDGAEWHDRISKGRIDDVIDAAVLAHTAQLIDLQPRSDKADYPALPEDPENDEKLGVPMEIVYPGAY
ncbi:DUF429 domain-containing protein [Haloferax namakaokahaiae]|uniref:DUF429 domain-containing protein n=1 Tax=Haloferax namakaokahaiae TaxID=1748331 RepID=A0ABD5ZJQ5_9EURY